MSSLPVGAATVRPFNSTGSPSSVFGPEAQTSKPEGVDLVRGTKLNADDDSDQPHPRAITDPSLLGRGEQFNPEWDDRMHQAVQEFLDEVKGGSLDIYALSFCRLMLPVGDRRRRALPLRALLCGFIQSVIPILLLVNVLRGTERGVCDMSPNRYLDETFFTNSDDKFPGYSFKVALVVLTMYQAVELWASVESYAEMWFISPSLRLTRAETASIHLIVPFSGLLFNVFSISAIAVTGPIVLYLSETLLDLVLNSLAVSFLRDVDNLIVRKPDVDMSVDALTPFLDRRACVGRGLKPPSHRFHSFQGMLEMTSKLLQMALNWKGNPVLAFFSCLGMIAWLGIIAMFYFSLLFAFVFPLFAVVCY